MTTYETLRVVEPVALSRLHWFAIQEPANVFGELFDRAITRRRFLAQRTHDDCIEVTFEAAPDLRRIYATALVTGRGRSGPLPEVRAVRRGIRIDVENLVDYARVCGFTMGGTLP